MSTEPDILIIAASETDANLYYATRFPAPDSFIFIRLKGERILLMSDLEVDRARATATVDTVLSYSEYEERVKRRASRRRRPSPSWTRFCASGGSVAWLFPKTSALSMLGNCRRGDTN